MRKLIKEKHIQKMKNINTELSKFYKKNYFKLVLIPVFLMILSIFSIVLTFNQTGSIIHRDVSLSGGVSAIIEVDVKYGTFELKKILEDTFTDNSFSVSFFSYESQNKGYIIDTDLDEKKLVEKLESLFGIKMDTEKNYSSNFISETLSNAFLQQASFILLLSFFLMAVVVFLYFREIVPSFSVILSVIFDLVVLVGVLDLLGFKISIAGIGAIIMILGYSIDTDILLTNRLVKEKGFDYFSKAHSAFKTGNLMSLTTLSATITTMIFTNSEVIFEIVFILSLGIIIDYISTWVQNSGILLKWVINK